MTLQEYIEQNPLKPLKGSMEKYDETIYQLYTCLDAIGFQGQMGYKDRALLREWLSTIGEAEKEIVMYVREAIKHPSYQKRKK